MQLSSHHPKSICTPTDCLGYGLERPHTLDGIAKSAATKLSALKRIGYVTSWEDAMRRKRPVSVTPLRYGDDVEGDGCDSNCTVTGCGNGVVTGDEACDDGEANSDVLADACRSDCSEAGCGDGAQDTGEGCDDGNDVEGDGCDSNCTVTG